jgi:ABC-2 type transport system ATP-binding protein
MELLAARSVTKSFSAHKALSNVSISVPEGSIFGLLGPNGAGKTTLIRIINQIIAPDNGELWLEGRKMIPADIRKIGYLPEERGLYKKMKVGEQAVYLARLKGLSLKEAEKRLMFWFSNFEIMGWWNRKVEELSKGMQQKVQFIVTVVHQPRLLIFDEPFSGFDPINVNLLKEEILALREKGSTIIFSTHNMASVEELCDHIALIDKSEKILDGNISEIKKRFRTNTYEVTFGEYRESLRNFLPPSFGILDERVDGTGGTGVISLPVNAGPNDLLRELIPHVSLASLREIIPSMNDIFIRTVTERKEQEHIPS